MFPPAGSLSAQSIDQQWATNVLGHFHLTNLLVPLLARSSRTEAGFPRVVNTSSSGHWLLSSSGGINFDSLKVPEGETNPLDTYRLYGQSKLVRIISVI
jgi:retinol dehydrogenase-12